MKLIILNKCNQAKKLYSNPISHRNRLRVWYKPINTSASHKYPSEGCNRYEKLHIVLKLRIKNNF